MALARLRNGAVRPAAACYALVRYRGTDGTHAGTPVRGADRYAGCGAPGAGGRAGGAATEPGTVAAVGAGRDGGVGSFGGAAFEVWGTAGAGAGNGGGTVRVGTDFISAARGTNSVEGAVSEESSAGAACAEGIPSSCE